MTPRHKAATACFCAASLLLITGTALCRAAAQGDAPFTFAVPGLFCWGLGLWFLGWALYAFLPGRRPDRPYRGEKRGFEVILPPGSNPAPHGRGANMT